MNKIDNVISYLDENPKAQKWSKRKISDTLHVSEKTVQRALRKFRDKIIPNILLFDIETSPMEVYVWGLYKQRINPDNVIKDWSVLSWAAKWLFNDEIMGEVVTGEEAEKREDWRILEEMWWLLDEADIVIGHNSMQFDHRKLNARFVLNDMEPPMPYQVIDTKRASAKHFAFSSHKLNYLSLIMKNKEKMKTDFELWKRCVRGDVNALEQMLEYNKRDVLLLEEVYLEMRPWIKSHPNLGLYVDTDKEVCPTCYNKELDWRGFYHTPAGRFKAFRCKGCGAIGRSRFSDLSADERRNLTISVAR